MASKRTVPHPHLQRAAYVSCRAQNPPVSLTGARSLNNTTMTAAKAEEKEKEGQANSSTSSPPTPTPTPTPTPPPTNDLPYTLRDIVLPRPLANPPEYEQEQERLARHTTGNDDDPGPRPSSFTRLCDGVRLYASTWRRRDADREEAGVEPSSSARNDSDNDSRKQIDSLLDEVRLQSTTVSGVAKHQYAIRARAFQLAVKEFVAGWHETRGWQ